MPPKSDFPGTGAERQRHLAERQEPGRVDSQHRQHRRLHRLPSDGQQGHARDSAESLGTFAIVSRGVGPPRPVRAGRRRHERALHAGRPRPRARDVRATGPIGSPRASCRPQRRRVRRARERNVVVTMWDWADPKAYLHDEIATDKRNPTVNANGPIYGALEDSADYMSVVDPTRHTASQIKLKVRDPKTPSAADSRRRSRRRTGVTKRSGTARPRAHSFAMDSQARVWVAARIRPEPRRRRSAGRARITRRRRRSRSIRAAGSCRCTTRRRKRSTTIDTCFGTHHLNFDDNDMLWFTGGGPVEGWFNTGSTTRPRTRQKAQGWTRVRPRHQRQRQARRVRRAGSAGRSDQGQADQRAVLRRRAELPTDRSGDRCWACPDRSCA